MSDKSQKFRNKLSSQNLFVPIFASTIFVLFFLFLYFLSKNPWGPQRYIFFQGCTDFFADFFNVVKGTTGRDIYNLPNFFFPLTFFHLIPFTKLDNFTNMTLQEMWTSKLGILGLFFYLLVSISFMFFSLNYLRIKYNVNPIIILCLFLSSPFIYSVERGNNVILSAAFIGFFVRYYDSKVRKERFLAMLSLAIIASLKIYPILFGFLYFKKKQYKDILYSSVICLFVAIFPFIFFKNGLLNIFQLLNGFEIGQGSILESSPHSFINLGNNILPRFSLQHIIFLSLKLINKILHLDLHTDSMIPIVNHFQYFIYLLSIITILVVVFAENEWIRVSLISLLTLYLPFFSSYYYGLNLFPSIIIFFGTLKERKMLFNIFILFAYLALLNPLQFSVPFNNGIVNFNYIISNIGLIILWFVLIFAGIKKILLEWCLKKEKA